MNIHQELRELKELISNLYLVQKKTLLHAEAARYMGISTSYLYYLGREEKIPVSCPEGKLKYYKKEDLDAFMLKGRKRSKDEIINEVN